MITISKAILGLTVLASAGAYSLVEPATAARAPAPSAIIANGKVADRLPVAHNGKLSGPEIIARIRSAHNLPTGLPTQVASVDCKAFAWPNIPAECLTSTDGAPIRKPARVISTASQSAAAPATASLTRQPDARTVVRH